MLDKLQELKVRGLILKGFDKEEIANMLRIPKEDANQVEIKEFSSDEYYSELQKDLAKLVLTEMNKEKRDSTIIFNSIKLQAELQEKKRQGRDNSKINKSYIYERDTEISKMAKLKISEEEIAKKFNISILSVRQAIDRSSLELKDELRDNLSPSIISETIGLEKKVRLKLLNDAYQNRYTREAVRRIVNQIKNEAR